MASFENDIFISYAHLDNRGGWVDAFHTSLSNWLGVLGVTARICRDKELRGDDVFSEKILGQLKRSALLISIVSPNGMRSNWCDKERQRFEQYAEANIGFRIGDAVRAFKVVRTPAEGDAHEPLFGTLGYEFFEKNPQTGHYDHYLPGETKFERVIERLAQDIQAMLKTVAAVAGQPARRVIYVAEVSGDLQSDRTKVADELTTWGFRVVPSSPLPIGSPELRAAIEPALAAAVLSIHLFSDKRGTIPDDEEKSIPAIQYELANARKLDQIVWIFPGTKPHTSIEEVIRAGVQPERLEQQTLEQLKDVIGDKLKSLAAPAAIASRTGKLIYILCDQEDRKDALELKSYLDRRGFIVWLPIENGSDPRELGKQRRDALKESAGVIFYWGTAAELWFQRSWLEFIRIVRTRPKSRPVAATVLYLQPPPMPEKDRYRNNLDLAVEQVHGLQPFLERLANAREAAAK